MRRKQTVTELETFVAEQIKTLIPHYDMVELEAAVTASSLSVEFFVTVDGKKMQCFQMIDDGLFTEKNFNTAAKAIAAYVREQPDFRQDGINRYHVVLEA